MSQAIPEVGARIRVRRRSQRGHYDRATIEAILDESFVCHVGFVHDGYASVIPTAYVRHGAQLYLHGSVANRMLQALKGGAEACICVTLVDGLVLARSAFHQSVNYRSVVMYGRAEEVVGADKVEALRRLVDHVVPNRWRDVRPPSTQELQQTLVLKFPIAEASAKVRTGPPLDGEEDRAIPCWAGEIPLQLVAGDPVPAPDVRADQPFPAHLKTYRRAVR